jgi:hypothetical protein
VQPHHYLTPPIPSDPARAQQVLETRRRRRLLEGMWGVDLEHRLQLQFGLVRRVVIGPKSKARNLYRRLMTELAVLYRNSPKTWAATDATPFLGPDGMVARSGLWPLMRSVQTYTLGLREELVRIDWDPVTKRPAYRQVHADTVADARSRALDPSVPVEVRELRWFDSIGRWCHEVVSIENIDRPVYRIEELTNDGRPGPDRTVELLGRPASGPLYPFRYTQGERRGMPFLPYVLYHADVGSCLWDPFAWTELADASIEVAASWTWWGHLLYRASWPQRYGIDVYVEGTVPEEDGEGALRSEVPADPSSLVHLRGNPNAKNPTVGQWAPSADILTVAQAIGLFERGCSDIAGIDAAHIVRESADAWSGAALSISRDGKREAQTLYEPMFQPRDVELLEKSAAIVNLAEELDRAMPESGYRVIYTPIGLSGQELEGKRRHNTELVDKGRMGLVEAYIDEHPGSTGDEARKALVGMRVERLQIEADAKKAAEAAGLVAPAGDAKEISGVIGELGLDIMARTKTGEFSLAQGRAALQRICGLSAEAALDLIPEDLEVRPPPAPPTPPAVPPQPGAQPPTP